MYLKWILDIVNMIFFCQMESLWVCTNVFQEVENNIKAKIYGLANPSNYEGSHCLLSCEIISPGKNCLLVVLVIENGCTVMLLKIFKIFKNHFGGIGLLRFLFQL